MTTIKESPILFNGPMVRAILEGRKTVTRRAIKHQPYVPISDAIPRRNYPHGPATADWYWRPQHRETDGVPSHDWNFKCPFGQPGDRMWVREAWSADAQVNAVAPRNLSQGEPLRYPADGAAREFGCSMITSGKTRPSIHMPRWASRITLEITDLRVERLQEISFAQALAEGARSTDDGFYEVDAGTYVGADPRETFAKLWRSTGGDWPANPWVWIVEFKRVNS